MNSAALLQRQGWRGQGFSLDETDRGLSRPLLVQKRNDLAGIGKPTHDFANQWWLRAWDQPKSAENITTASSPAQASGKKASLYSGFKQSNTLVGTFPVASNPSSQITMAGFTIDADASDSHPKRRILYNTSFTGGEIIGDVPSNPDKIPTTNGTHEKQSVKQKNQKSHGAVEDKSKHKGRKRKHGGDGPNGNEQNEKKRNRKDVDRKSGKGHDAGKADESSEHTNSNDKPGVQNLNDKNMFPTTQAQGVRVAGASFIPLDAKMTSDRPPQKEKRRAPRTIRKEKMAAKRAAERERLIAEGKPIPKDLAEPPPPKGKKKKGLSAREQLRRERKEKRKEKQKSGLEARKQREAEALRQEALEEAAKDKGETGGTVTNGDSNEGLQESVHPDRQGFVDDANALSNTAQLPEGQKPLPPADQPLKLPYIDPSTIDPMHLPDGRPIIKNLSMKHYRRFLQKEGLKQSLINAYIAAYQNFKEGKAVEKEKKKAERRQIRKIQRAKPKSQKRAELEEKRARKEALREARIENDPKLARKVQAKQRKSRNLAINTAVILRRKEAEQRERGVKPAPAGKFEIKQARREARRIQRHAKSGRLGPEEIPDGFALKRSYRLQLKGNGGRIPKLEDSLRVRKIHDIGNGGPEQ